MLRLHSHCKNVQGVRRIPWNVFLWLDVQVEAGGCGFSTCTKLLQADSCRSCLPMFGYNCAWSLGTDNYSVTQAVWNQGAYLSLTAANHSMCD